MKNHDERSRMGHDRDAAIRRAHDEIAASSSEAGPYLPSGGRGGNEPWSVRRAVNLAVAMLIIVGPGAIVVVSIGTMNPGSDVGPTVTSSSSTVPVSRE